MEYETVSREILLSAIHLSGSIGWKAGKMKEGTYSGRLGVGQNSKTL